MKIFHNIFDETQNSCFIFHMSIKNVLNENDFRFVITINGYVPYNK